MGISKFKGEQAMKRYTLPIIAGLAVALRLWNISAASLWYDETFSLILARLPFRQMIQATAADVHPPLSYIPFWALVHLAPSAPPWTLRIISMIFSLIALWLFWLVMQELHIDHRVKLAALFIAAVNPWNVYYAQEIRMYALLQMLFLLALLGILQRRWWLFVLAAVGMCYTHNYGVLYTATLALVAVMRSGRDWWRSGIASFVVAAVWLPWATVIPGQVHTINASGGYWISPTNIGAVMDIFNRILIGWSQPVGIWLPITVTSLTWLGVGILAATNAIRDINTRVVLVLAFMPLLIAMTISAVFDFSILLHRPLLPSSLFWYLLMALPITAIENDIAPTNKAMWSCRLTVAYALTIVAIGLVLPAMGFMVYGPTLKAGDSLDSMVTYIQANWQEGDVIYSSQDSAAVRILGTLPNYPQYELPTCQLAEGYISPASKVAMGIVGKQLEDISHRRAWVLWGVLPNTPRCEFTTMQAILSDRRPLMVMASDDFSAWGGLFLIER